MWPLYTLRMLKIHQPVETEKSRPSRPFSSPFSLWEGTKLPMEITYISLIYVTNQINSCSLNCVSRQNWEYCHRFWLALQFNSFNSKQHMVYDVLLPVHTVFLIFAFGLRMQNKCDFPQWALPSPVLLVSLKIKDPLWK